MIDARRNFAGRWYLVVLTLQCFLLLSLGLMWTAAGADLGFGGVSFFEILILYELWAGERLFLEKPFTGIVGRPISSVGCSVWSRH